jgi:hypothetical protein
MQHPKHHCSTTTPPLLIDATLSHSQHDYYLCT